MAALQSSGALDIIYLLYAAGFHSYEGQSVCQRDKVDVSVWLSGYMTHRVAVVICSQQQAMKPFIKRIRYVPSECLCLQAAHTYRKLKRVNIQDQMKSITPHMSNAQNQKAACEQKNKKPLCAVLCLLVYTHPQRYVDSQLSLRQSPSGSAFVTYTHST